MSEIKRAHLSSSATLHDFTLDSLNKIKEFKGVSEFRMSTENSDPSVSVIRGRLEHIEAPSGLTVHVTDTTDVQATTAEWITQPAFFIAVVLDGRLDAWLDGELMPLNADAGPTGYFWNVVEPLRTRRQVNRGTRIRKVVIKIPQPWIKELIEECRGQGLPNPCAFETHLARGNWNPSRHTLALAEKLITPAVELPTLSMLSAEAKATEIVREAISCILADHRPEENQPITTVTNRAMDVRDRIMQDLSASLNLTDIATDLAISVGSMQSAFKATYAMTIGTFIRKQRLARARFEIEQEGKRVSEAAYAAGYDNPSSFSTAFRKEFGISPSECKS